MGSNDEKVACKKILDKMGLMGSQVKIKLSLHGQAAYSSRTKSSQLKLQYCSSAPGLHIGLN